MNPIRILLVEDHHLVRAGIRSLLLGVAGVQVVGETGDGREALRLIAEVRPNVVLMDIALPGLNGLEATARAVKDFPNVRVIMLSMNRAEEYVLRRCAAAPPATCSRTTLPSSWSRPSEWSRAAKPISVPMSRST